MPRSIEALRQLIGEVVELAVSEPPAGGDERRLVREALGAVAQELFKAHRRAPHGSPRVEWIQTAIAWGSGCLHDDVGGDLADGIEVFRDDLLVLHDDAELGLSR